MKINRVSEIKEFKFDYKEDFPSFGEESIDGILIFYIAKNTELTYIWDGAKYVQICLNMNYIPNLQETII